LSQEREHGSNFRYEFLRLKRRGLQVWCPVMRRHHLIVAASIVVSAGGGGSFGCAGGGGTGAREPVKCGAEERVQLNCDSEFKYDGRKIEGGFTALGIGNANAKTDETALRQIDQQTEQFVAQARRLCDEYNACVLDKDTYSTRSENLRRRMSKVPELYDSVKAATQPAERTKALSAAYQALVPDEARRELTLDLGVRAKRPDAAEASLLGPGSSLPTNSRVSFWLKVSHPAYVYLFQKSPDGSLNVLFPDARISTPNPVPAGVELRIPSGDASYRLNEKDVGTERVYVVASLDALSNLEQAAQRVASGQKPDGQLATVTEMPKNSGTCNSRALELDDGAPTPCVRSRGLELDSEPQSTGGASLRARTEAADSVLVQVFSFEHTP
jgi:hypothetical protein